MKIMAFKSAPPAPETTPSPAPQTSPDDEDTQADNGSASGARVAGRARYGEGGGKIAADGTARYEVGVLVRFLSSSLVLSQFRPSVTVSRHVWSLYLSLRISEKQWTRVSIFIFW